MPEEESLGALVAQASNHISTLVRSEIELAKSELKFDAKRVGMAAGLFAAAAFMLHLVLILGSFTIAYVLIDVAGLDSWLAFLIVTAFYVVTALLLAFIGYRRLKGLAGFRRTKRSLSHLKPGDGDEPPALHAAVNSSKSAYTGPTAGQVGTHRETVNVPIQQ